MSTGTNRCSTRGSAASEWERPQNNGLEQSCTPVYTLTRSVGNATGDWRCAPARSSSWRYPGPKDCGERVRETDLRVIP